MSIQDFCTQSNYKSVTRDYHGSAKPAGLAGMGWPGTGWGWNLATRCKPKPMARVLQVPSGHFLLDKSSTIALPLIQYLDFFLLVSFSNSLFSLGVVPCVVTCVPNSPIVSFKTLGAQASSCQASLLFIYPALVSSTAYLVFLL
jgi:hypothetical protein